MLIQLDFETLNWCLQNWKLQISSHVQRFHIHMTIFPYVIVDFNKTPHLSMKMFLINQKL